MLCSPRTPLTRSLSPGGGGRSRWQQRGACARPRPRAQLARRGRRRARQQRGKTRNAAPVRPLARCAQGPRQNGGDHGGQDHHLVGRGPTINPSENRAHQRHDAYSPEPRRRQLGIGAPALSRSSARRLCRMRWASTCCCKQVGCGATLPSWRGQRYAPIADNVSMAAAGTAPLEEAACDRPLVPVDAGARPITRGGKATDRQQRLLKEILAPVHELQPVLGGCGGQHVCGEIGREMG